MTELQLADWRRHVFHLYAAVREQDHPAAAHQFWREGRDALFREHPQSPLSSSDPIRASGLPCWPYDPGLRFQLPLTRARDPVELSLPTGGDGTTLLRRVGVVQLPAPLDSTLDVWWLDQYAAAWFSRCVMARPVRAATVEAVMCSMAPRAQAWDQARTL